MEKSMGKLEGWKLCHGLSSTFGERRFLFTEPWLVRKDFGKKKDRIKTLRLLMIRGASPIVPPQKFLKSATPRFTLPSHLHLHVTYSKRRFKIALSLRRSSCLPSDLQKLVQGRKFFVSGFNLYCLSSKRKLGGGGSILTFQKDSQIGGTCFCWYTKIFVDVMFIAQKVYSIYCYHWHFALSPPKLQKLSHGQFYVFHYSSSVVYHFGFFPRLIEKIRVQDPLLPKLGFLIFRTPGTVGIYQHLVWGLRKNPGKNIGKSSALFYLGALY